MFKIVESTVVWRGSISDLATDVAWLLTPEEGKALIQELEEFLWAPRGQGKFAGKGRKET